MGRTLRPIARDPLLKKNESVKLGKQLANGKSARGYKTGGRQRGTPNNITRALKDAVQTAYGAIGGDSAFATWAKANPTEFYKIAARLIPQEMRHSDDGGQLVVNILRFAPGNAGRTGEAVIESNGQQHQIAAPEQQKINLLPSP